MSARVVWSMVGKWLVYVPDPQGGEIQIALPPHMEDEAKAIVDGLALMGMSDDEWDGPLTPADQSRIDEAWERHKAATPCSIPPTGWRCSRGAGHKGPCAATPTLPSDQGSAS